MDDSSGHIEHDAAACVSTHFRLEFPALEWNVDELESSKPVNAQSAGSKGDGLLLFVVLNVVHVLCGPYISFGNPVRHQGRFEPNNRAGKSAKDDVDIISIDI